MATSAGVVVYWWPGCPYCMMLRSGLRKTGLPFDEIDIWSEPTAAGYVRSVAGGNETVPTVRVGDRPLVNPSVREVLKAAVAPGGTRSRGAALRRARRPRARVALSAAQRIRAMAAGRSTFGVLLVHGSR